MLAMVVEDDTLLRVLVGRLLRRAGFEVLGFGSADEAAALLEAPPAELAVLVTDVHLGGPLDGIALATRARAARPGLPVVAISGDPDALDRARFSGIADRVLAKPFDMNDLVRAVVQTMAARRAEAVVA